MFKSIKVLLSLIPLLAPMIVFAAPNDFRGLVDLFVDIINLIIPVIISLIILGFFWGVTKYILPTKDSANVEDGRKFMIYGLIGMFVAFSVWGILNILARTFL